MEQALNEFVGAGIRQPKFKDRPEGVGLLGSTATDSDSGFSPSTLTLIFHLMEGSSELSSLLT